MASRSTSIVTAAQISGKVFRSSRSRVSKSFAVRHWRYNGGTALLGVVNIISKSAEELDGIHVGAGLAYASSGVKSREYASVMLGSGAGGPVKLTAMAHTGRALRSDRTYQDVNGATFNMANAERRQSGFVNMGLQTGNFRRPVFGTRIRKSTIAMARQTISVPRISRIFTTAIRCFAATSLRGERAA